MSSFKCEKCGTNILDSEDGYYTECEHYPLEPQVKKKRITVKWDKIAFMGMPIDKECISGPISSPIRDSIDEVSTQISLVMDRYLKNFMDKKGITPEQLKKDVWVKREVDEGISTYLYKDEEIFSIQLDVVENRIGWKILEKIVEENK